MGWFTSNQNHNDPSRFWTRAFFNTQWRTKCAVINWKCAVTKGCLCSDKTLYQRMKMFTFKDPQSTMSFYGHCSFTYLWNMHLIGLQLHDGIHNATVINALQNLQSAISRAVLYNLSPAHPSDCPHLSVHLSHGLINQQESCAIAKMTARCALYT